jgi:hypothetical protein
LRSKIVLATLILFFAGFIALRVVRPREPYRTPAAPSAEPVTSAPSASAPSPSASAAASASAGAPAEDPKRLLDRPLRVTALGWDLLAPGLLANGGMAPAKDNEFSALGLEVHLSSLDGMGAVESALARGGAEKDGADVAIVPLPAFVASYERLRALRPVVFFVVGWSRGREAIVSARDSLTALPPAGEVRMAGVAGDAATFLGLFALEVSGIALSDVRLVAPTGDKPGDSRGDKSRDVAFAAVDRSVSETDSSRKLLLTTADAPRLVPFVAIAPQSLIEQKGDAMIAWARGWLSGSQKLAADTPAGARQISRATGAPDPLALLKRLGDLGPASIQDNARMAGLSGRGAVTLESLFQHTYQIWRATGALATPAPEAAPIATTIIASLARSDAARLPGFTPAAPAKPPTIAAEPRNAKPILLYRQSDKLDEATLIAVAGLLAGVFERSPIRIAVQAGGGVDAARTRRLIGAVEGRFDIPAGRLVAATKATPKAQAAVEILALP